MPSVTAPSSTGLLYVVYLENGPLCFRHFEAQVVESRDPQRDTENCPEWSYGFCYATGPQTIDRFSQLNIVSGFYFVDAIIIPTIRLRDYCTSTGAYPNVDELLRNSAGALCHAHSRDGRFYPFDVEKDRLMSTTRA